MIKQRRVKRARRIEEEKGIQNFDLKERDHLEGLDVDGNIYIYN
jgi:hypothetical protein